MAINAGIVAGIILIVLIVWIIMTSIRIVPQATAVVVERLGAYQATWDVGLHLKMPFIDRIAKRVILKEQVVDFPPQPVITNRYGCLLPDHRSEAVYLRRRESDHGNRQPDRDNAEKYHR